MTRPRYTVSLWRARLGSAEIGALGVLVVGVLAFPYTVDDAFIVGRYARNLVAGLGYAINPEQPSDGVTGPLWLLPEMLACALHLDPIAVAKILGLGCSVLAAYLALRWLRARCLGRNAACAAAIVIASSPSLATWGVAGLETGLATLLTTIAALSALARPRPKPLALGATCALLAWLRPELALCCALLLFATALRERTAAVRAAALALFGLASVFAFRLALFGHALPLSLRAKAGSIAHGVSYALNGVLLATSVAGAVLVWFGARHAARIERTLTAALLAQLCAVVLAGGDWMPGYRLLVPVLPLYAVLVGLAAARLGLRRPRLALSAVALACALPLFDLVTRIPELRASVQSRSRADELAIFLKTRAPRVALVDIGYLGYTSGVELIDLAGLTDESIASMAGGHLDKHITAAYLQARAPLAIVLHSARVPDVSPQGELRSLDGFEVERRVASMRFVREAYRVDRTLAYAPHYFYAVLVRRGLDR